MITSPRGTAANLLLTLLLLIILPPVFGQSGGIRWAADGNSYFRVEENEIVQYTLPANEKTYLVRSENLIPAGQSDTLSIRHYIFSPDASQMLIYTNTAKVWRLHTKGDYWLLDLGTNTLKKLGASRPASSLMFAKFSPDGTKVAYVSENNLYVEDLATNTIQALTTDGTRKLINGTFDWAYEEEFVCRDGFRWSPDSRSIAYWQLDAQGIRDFFMINNTDSIYPSVVPVEYPKVGQNPSACRVGVVDLGTKKTTWMNITGDPRQHYLVRMEYIPGTSELLVQQLNRKQNESKLIRCHAATGAASTIFSETDAAWIDIVTPATDNVYTVDFKHNFDWIGSKGEFLWTSEKDGWRHLYRLSADGKKVTLVTPGAYDVISLKAIDEKSGFAYFLASPDNATQKYLFRTRLTDGQARLDGKGKLQQVTPEGFPGTHNYQLSPNGRFARHSYSNSYTRLSSELVSLPGHKALQPAESIAQKLDSLQTEKTTEFFKITTADGVEMDGWMAKPANFDPSKKYPLVFYVYTEPWGQNVVDAHGVSKNFLYSGDMREDGYIYIALDNRGTPVPKGAAWRKAIYRKMGVVNIRDQAMAVKEILKWAFVDPERVAVWGWSGGGSATLNLLFQYPEIYKTGIAIAAVANQLTYDNIYQERYMGLPQENMADFIQGSPITHAKNLAGNLLYIHGTGDDNVHYQNAELLLNELIKHNKQFQFMPYPNRTHGLSEGESTFKHLTTLYTNFLRLHCPPGGR